MNKFILSILLCFTLVSLTACTNNEPETKTTAQNKQIQAEVNKETVPPEFNKQTALNLMNEYSSLMNSLLKDARDDLKITSYQSKEEITIHLNEIMSKNLASTMTDSFFTEKAEGLYVIPRDAPTFLNESQPFDIEKVTDTHYKIIQEQSNELIGHVTMVYHAILENNNWLISDIESLEMNSLTKEEPLTDSEPTEDLSEVAQTVVSLIADKDFHSLSSMINPEKGVLFSPYVYIEKDAIVFPPKDIKTFFENSSVYTWGTFDGSGEPITLTPSDYYEKFIYEKPYIEAEEILVNEFKQRGNTINNIKDRFPNSAIVEFHITGTSEFAGMDWASLNLVFEKEPNGVWTLVAIINDRWTI
ncbi:hypothetical protein [Bacillus sp. Marseille-P3661]|uniref:hypothetical protein n=1 Tax=Bacillus sp. Marseille-P3661 TaxID=1936234 RepID=UPI000C8610F6|nr:hypothetical protein [Bacillus sp. Marseille-P3661]